GYLHADAVALPEGCRPESGSVARGIFVDPLPGRRRAHRHPDADGQPGTEHVLQHLGRHRRLSPGPNRPLDLPFCVSRRNRLALVVEALALGQADLQLDAVPFPVEPQRYEGQAFLFDRDAQADDLGAVQQQLALPLRLVIRAMPSFIRTDMDVDEERLSPTEANVAFAQVGAAVTQRLDLGPLQLDAGLDRFEDEVVVIGGAVAGDRRVDFALLLPH